MGDRGCGFAAADSIDQVLDDRPGDVDARGLLQPFPARNAVDFEHEDLAVTRRQKIHAGVVRADGRVARTARSAQSGGSSNARTEPPRETFVRQSPAGAVRSMAPITRPPTTNARTSRPP